MADAALTLDAPIGSPIARVAPSAVAGAIVAGAAFALSPLGTMAVALCGWMAWRASRTLDASDRVSFWWIVGAAVAARLLVVMGLFVIAAYAGRSVITLVPDADYLIERAAILRNAWMAMPLGPHQYREIFNPYGASSYVSWLALLDAAAGSSPSGLALVSVACHVAGGLLLFQPLREAFGSRAARAALALLLFWPTLFVWSVSVLKESAQFLLMSVTLVTALRIPRASSWAARAGWLAALAGALGILWTFRTGSLAIAAGGLGLAVAAALLLSRRGLLAIALAIALVIGWRAQHAMLDQVRAAANRHYGHVISAGVSYRVLDQRFYSGGPDAISKMTAADAARYLVASAVMFIAAPVPWSIASGSLFSGAAIVPQQLAWYCGVAAACAGVGFGLRRDRWLTMLLAAYAVAGLIIIAPNSGNIGTLVRHRDMIVPFVIALAAPACAALAAAIAKLRPERES